MTASTAVAPPAIAPPVADPTVVNPAAVEPSTTPPPPVVSASEPDQLDGRGNITHTTSDGGSAEPSAGDPPSYPPKDGSALPPPQTGLVQSSISPAKSDGPFGTSGTSATKRNPWNSAPSHALDALAQSPDPVTKDPAPRVPIEMPLPSSDDIDHILELYEKNAPWDELINAINKARPYELTRAGFPVTIGTGTDLVKESPMRIFSSLVHDHGSAVLSDMFENGEVGQVTKMRGKNLRRMVTTKAGQQRLRNQIITILNKEYRVVERNRLEDFFCLDIFDFDSNNDLDRLMVAFGRAGASVLYTTFREVARKRTTMGSLRVYFKSERCPEALYSNGAVCDQILFRGMLHLAHGKAVAPSGTRIPFGKRSAHLVDLDAAMQPPPPPAIKTTGSKRGRNAEAPEVVFAPPPGLDLSVSGEAAARHGLDTSFQKPKRTRPPPAAIDRTQQPWHTNNYYGALAEVSASIECDTWNDDDDQVLHYEISPKAVTAPKNECDLKEASYNIVVKQDGSGLARSMGMQDISSLVASMEKDVQHALDIAAAKPSHPQDKQLETSISAILSSEANGDKLVQTFLDHGPICTKLVTVTMRSTPNAPETLGYVHLVNRAISAGDTATIQPFSEKLALFCMEDNLESISRENLLLHAEQWRPEQSEEDSLCFNYSVAISFFELMLIATAPTLHQSDNWIKWLTKATPAWIPTVAGRLLTANTLLAILRSAVGELLLSQWAAVNWDATIVHTLVELRKSDMVFAEENEELMIVTGKDDEDILLWNSINVLTANVNGIKRNGHVLVQQTLSNYQLSCLQETKFRDQHHFDTFNFHLKAAFPHKCFHSDIGSESPTPRSPRSCGVAAILHPRFPGYDTAEVVDALTICGRYLVVRCVVEGSPLYIHNVYAPVLPTQKEALFNSLPVDDFEDNATHFVLGDLNLALEPHLDSSSTSDSSGRGRSACHEWIAILGVVDIWRLHHPDDQVFSGPQPRRNRLDYIMVSDVINRRFYRSSKYFEARGGGDHLAHSVLLSTSLQPRVSSHWKFPPGLLKYPQVVQGVRDEATELLASIREADNPGLVWEGWKKRVASSLQRVQRKIKEQDEQIHLRAKHKLEIAANLYRQQRSPELRIRFQEALAVSRETLKQLSQLRQDSAFDLHATQSEKPTSYFFRPNDASLRRVPIDRINLPSGIESSEPPEIAQGFVRHWGAIFGDPVYAELNPQQPDSPSQARLLNSITKCLSSDQSAALNEPITAADLASAIKHMSPRSSPGLDGLSAAFYQVDPTTFGEILATVFQDQLCRGTLLPSQRKTCAVLLHKKGSRADPGNYRPIALMQVDVKILSKALAYRIQKLLNVLIHRDQAGFISMRSMHHHVRLLKELQHYVTKHNLEGYALFLDFEKAYDRVNWSYMEQVLLRMNCGQNTVNWVRLLYKDPVAKLQLNGSLHSSIRPTRGVKQGDPLSCFLFLLCIEPLGQLLRQEPSKGISLPGGAVATGLYFADDSTILSSSTPNLQDQLDLVHVYCAGSGASLNLQKSALLSLNRTSKCPPFQQVRVLAAPDSVTYLGIPFSQSHCDTAILQRLDEAFYGGLKLWCRRARTIRGRVLLCNSVILSRLWHLTAHVSIPDATVRRWQASVTRFVLSRKHGRDSKSIQLIASEFVHLPVACGGLQVPQIAVTLRRQRFNLLQQYASMCASPRLSLWVAVSSAIFQDVLPQYGESYPLDFLTVNPAHSKNQLRLDLLSDWWHSTWKMWGDVEWPVNIHTIPDAERMARVLCEPVWLHRHSAFQVCTTRATSTNRSVGEVPEPHRSFRIQLVRQHNLRCLFDFVNENGEWPSEGEFLARFMQHSPGSPSLVSQCRWLHPLYRDLLQVVGAVNFLGSCADLTGLALFPSQFSPAVGVPGQKQTRYFPHLRRADVSLLLPNGIRGQRAHPITAHSESSTEEVLDDSLAFATEHRGFMLPVINDFQLRLAFRLIPVGYRLSFLHKNHPERLYCPLTHCNSIETDRHILFECQHYQKVWQPIIQDWSGFVNTPITWQQVVLPHSASVNQEWLPDQDALLTLWNIIRAITAHAIWLDRNAVVFKSRSPTPPRSLVAKVLSTFTAHVRALLRQDKAMPSSHDTTATQRVVTKLRNSPHFGSFFTNRSHLLKIHKVSNLSTFRPPR